MPLYKAKYIALQSNNISSSVKYKPLKCIICTLLLWKEKIVNEWTDFLKYNVKNTYLSYMIVLSY